VHFGPDVLGKMQISWRARKLPIRHERKDLRQLDLRHRAVWLRNGQADLPAELPNDQSYRDQIGGWRAQGHGRLAF
jgi:hypothetical protein